MYWTELKQINEELIGTGEWVKYPCPKCEGEWAIAQAWKIRQGFTAEKRVRTSRSLWANYHIMS